MNNKNFKPFKKIRYTPSELNKDIDINFYRDFPSHIESQLLSTKNNSLLVVDRNISKSIIDKIRRTLTLPKSTNIMYLDASEKSIKNVIKIWSVMVKNHPDVAIAIGGGTTCDLVGFASSSYHRGLDHVFIPTTLLSMVDAIIGGKTGIDFGNVKNSIGNIHYARESYSIFSLLNSLPQDELISGFSEVIKAGMLFDADLISKINALPSRFEITGEWLSVVSRGAQLKAQLCQKPMAERSRLLYGHNIGHGFETYGTTHRRHGDSVAIGMNYELALAVVGGLVTEKTWKDQNQLLAKFNLPNKFPKHIQLNQLKDSMKLYKLYKNNKFLFVIPKNPGVIFNSGNSYYWEVNEQQFDNLFYQALKLVET